MRERSQQVGGRFKIDDDSRTRHSLRRQRANAQKVGLNLLRDPIRVLCVDDHPMVLEGLASLIGRQPDMKLVGTASSGEEAITLYRIHQPHITLMDLQLPAMSGLDAIKAIRAEFATARIVVLTMSHRDDDVTRALHAGAATFVMKDVRSIDLTRLIREVHEDSYTHPDWVKTALTAGRAAALMTAREIEVLELVARGLRNKEIASELGVGLETTKAHVKHILAKLQVKDRTAAVTLALRRGILHLE